jgi:hypothetical protein
VSLSLESEIKQLEEQLLHSDLRSNPALFNELLSDDFEEIGTAGILNTRKDVVDWLLNKESNINWSLTNFSLRQLSDDLVLAKYYAKANNSNKVTHRSSLWKRVNSKTTVKWQMVFHQGTLISEQSDGSNG